MSLLKKICKNCDCVDFDPNDVSYCCTIFLKEVKFFETCINCYANDEYEGKDYMLKTSVDDIFDVDVPDDFWEDILKGS